MDEFERAKKRSEKRAAKKLGLSPVPVVEKPVKAPEKREENAVLLQGNKYTIPSFKKEGLTMVVQIHGFGRDEKYSFFHPNPEAYIPFQDYGRLREVLRLALNTKLPGIR